MISLRTFGTDNNEVGVTSTTIGFAVPVGIVDGDICVVAITVPTANITITPPDGWEFIKSTDKSRTVTILAYWKIALNEPAHWIFELSSASRPAGVSFVYSSADPFTPVEVSAAAQTSSSASHNVAGVTASLEAEQLVYVLAGLDAGTYTVPSGFTRIANRQTTTGTCEVIHRQLSGAGAIAATTVTFSSAVAGASLTLVIAPSYATRTIDDVRERIVGAFPVGADRVYDLTPTGDYYKLFQSVAAVLKLYGYDMIDTLRREAVVALSRYLLPTWETLFGLRLSKIAQLGTVPQRQDQVVAYWRSAAGQSSSRTDMAAAIKPLLGYFDSSPLQIIETNRAALSNPQSFANQFSIEPTGTLTVFPFAIPISSFLTVQYLKKDHLLTSQMGVQLFVEILTAPAAQLLNAVIIGPNLDGSENFPDTFVHVPGDQIAFFFIPSGSFRANTQHIFRAPAEDAGGCHIEGIWTIRFFNSSGVSTAQIDTPTLFTEGIGRGQANNSDGLGAAIFDFGVYADPSVIGENGRPADFPATRDMIARMKQAHTVGNLLQSLDPYPDVDTGLHAAIPDECISK